MKKKLVNYFPPLSIILFALLFSSCKREDTINIPLIDLGGDTWVQSATDKWLYDSVLVPYNIEVIYKSNISQNSADPNLLLAPPADSLVIPYMKVLKKIWLTVYDQASGSKLFMQRNAPKNILLVGSSDPNAAGVAEGGAKISLFGVNNFRSAAAVDLGLAHTVHHEFAHQLAALAGIPTAYALITRADYAGAGWRVATGDPNHLGFISAYARKDVGEDFAEMVSTMLVNPGFYASVLANPDVVRSGGAGKLKQKEQIITELFSDKLRIDFYQLQSTLQQSLK